MVSSLVAAAAFTAMQVVAPVPGQRSIFQICNPAGSQTHLYVDRIDLSHGINGPAGSDLRVWDHAKGSLIDNGLGTDSSCGVNKVLGGPCSGAEIREAWMVAPVDGVLMYEAWTPTARQETSYTFDPAITIPPGMCWGAASGYEYSVLIVSIQYREE